VQQVGRSTVFTIAKRSQNPRQAVIPTPKCEQLEPRNPNGRKQAIKRGPSRTSLGVLWPTSVVCAREHNVCKPTLDGPVGRRDSSRSNLSAIRTTALRPSISDTREQKCIWRAGTQLPPSNARSEHVRGQPWKRKREQGLGPGEHIEGDR